MLLFFITSRGLNYLIQTIKKNDNLQFVEITLEAIIRDFNWNKINGQCTTF
jgi:hypothetical protein